VKINAFRLTQIYKNMEQPLKAKRKILNDPVYGFINLGGDLVLDVIDHPYFQRLRRIKQLGLTHLVYPGALHTRFHHAIGAMNLMQQAINILRLKGHQITDDEEQASILAILLHDIGHGPYSHALENTLICETDHEELSLMFMHELNKQFDGQLDLCINIFKDNYPKKFLHQLISGQLDVDRLDYLKRDTFFTGVSEGVIGTQRIIKMLNVVDDKLVIEQKGIYSIEKFLLARRLMYWQVYLHKTVISAENLLIKILERARYLSLNETRLFASQSLEVFLKHDMKAIVDKEKLISDFAQLDDFDIMGAIKVWARHEDPVLAVLCKMLINRKLFRTQLSKTDFSDQEIQKKREEVATSLGISKEEAAYLVFTNSTSNSAYNLDMGPIEILLKSGETKDITQVSDDLDVSFYTKNIVKHYICYPKFLDE
jgi:HD superfamily phosphohydrolase